MRFVLARSNIFSRFSVLDEIGGKKKDVKEEYNYIIGYFQEVYTRGFRLGHAVT